MHFEGEFRVPGTPSEVIRRFEDVPRMASCMPGAVLEPQAEDGSWPGKMIVAFGPKKVAFKGKVTCSFDEENHTGTLNGRGTAGMRAARIGVKVSFALRPDPEPAEPRTIVKIVSDAELGGVLADFARTGGVAVANVIMADFARRASDEFAKDAVVVPSSTRDAAPESVESASREATAASAGLAEGAAPAGIYPPHSEARTAVREGAVHPTAKTIDAGSTGKAATGVRASAPETGGISRRPLTAAPEPAALSAHGILWAVFKAQFVRLAQWLGLRARDAGRRG